MAKATGGTETTTMDKPPPRGKLTVTLVGTRPLVLNQFPPRALAAIRATRTGQNRKQGKVREDRNPKIEFEECATEIQTPAGPRRTWPARAFLRQIAEAAIALGFDKSVASKAGVNRNIEVEGDAPGDPLSSVIEPAPIPNAGPAMREDCIILNGGQGSPDVRWRMQFAAGWTTRVVVHIQNVKMYPPTLVLNLLRQAGFLGIADGCIKPGTKPMGWGKFEVEMKNPVPAYEETQDAGDEITFAR